MANSPTDFIFALEYDTHGITDVFAMACCCLCVLFTRATPGLPDRRFSTYIFSTKESPRIRVSLLHCVKSFARSNLFTVSAGCQESVNIWW